MQVLSLQLFPVLLLKRHCPGKNFWCFPYLPQVILSFPALWVGCVLGDLHPTKGKPSLGVATCYLETGGKVFHVIKWQRTDWIVCVLVFWGGRTWSGKCGYLPEEIKQNIEGVAGSFWLCIKCKRDKWTGKKLSKIPELKTLENSQSVYIAKMKRML